MTPAKLLERMERRRDWLILLEKPSAQVASLIYNSHRSPGDKESGIAPAPVLGMEEFELYRRPKTLAAKDPRDYTLRGAEASLSDWQGYTKAVIAKEQIHGQR